MKTHATTKRKTEPSRNSQGRKRMKTTKPRSFITDIAAIIAVLIPAFLKKKQYCLWYHQQDMKWVKKAGPLSHRQCEKTRTVLVNDFHYAENAFSILRYGVTP